MLTLSSDLKTVKPDSIHQSSRENKHLHSMTSQYPRPPGLLGAGGSDTEVESADFCLKQSPQEQSILLSPPPQGYTETHTWLNSWVCATISCLWRAFFTPSQGASSPFLSCWIRSDGLEVRDLLVQLRTKMRWSFPGQTLRSNWPGRVSQGQSGSPGGVVILGKAWPL